MIAWKFNEDRVAFDRVQPDMLAADPDGFYVLRRSDGTLRLQVGVSRIKIKGTSFVIAGAEFNLEQFDFPVWASTILALDDACTCDFQTRLAVAQRFMDIPPIIFAQDGSAHCSLTTIVEPWYSEFRNYAAENGGGTYYVDRIGECVSVNHWARWFLHRFDIEVIE